MRVRGNTNMDQGVLFENPAVPRPRKRRPPTNEYLHVRRVKGGAFQARVWLGVRAGGSLNLGLFTTAEHPADPGRPEGELAEWAAGRASRHFRNRYRPGTPGRGLREVIEGLIRERLIPAHVLPPRVKRAKLADGTEVFVARVKKRGRVVETPGVFGDPWAAYSAMCAILEAEFPRGSMKSELRAAARAERERRRTEFERRTPSLFADAAESRAA